MQYNYKEAFCLMYYENAETKMGFVVWNSRDGVSPFIVFEDGKEYQHTHWHLDRPALNPAYIQLHILKPGQRVFRDVRETEAKEWAVQRLQQAKGTKFEVEEGSDRWNELIASLTEDFVGEGLNKQPHMVKVNADLTY